MAKKKAKLILGYVIKFKLNGKDKTSRAFNTERMAKDRHSRLKKAEKGVTDSKVVPVYQED